MNSVHSSDRKLTPRGEATRLRIVSIAAQLVSERGVSNVTLESLMEATGVSKSQLYHYFADRDSLLVEVIKFQTSRVLGLQETLLKDVNTMAGLESWRDAAVRLCEATSGMGGCPVGSLSSELSDRSESARMLLVEGFQMWEAQLETNFIAMQKLGEIKSSVEPKDLATAVIAALQGGILLSQVKRSSRPLELSLNLAISHIRTLKA